MELGVHLPLIEFGDEGQSLGRLQAVVDVARELGFAAVTISCSRRPGLTVRPRSPL
jgi:hypothetical protein